VTPGLLLGPHSYNPFALVASPELGLQRLGSDIPIMLASIVLHNF